MRKHDLIKKQKGITIVALVVTIIILLILAGISIQVMTNTGLFEKAGIAKKEAKRSQISEWLTLKLVEEQAENPLGTAEEIIQETRQNVYENINDLKAMGKEVTVEETSTEENGEQVEIYFYVIVDKDVYKVSLKEKGFIGELGKFSPIIKLESITGTTSSITVQVSTKRNDGGKIEYYIKTEDEENYVLKKTTTDTSYTYTGLVQNKKYNVKIVAIAENEQTAEVLVDRILGSVPDLAEGDITFSYSPAQGTWTKGSVTATVSTTITGYTLQTSKDGKTWSNETSQTFTGNGKIYAVLYDGTNYGGSATGNVTNIDTQAPKEFTPTAESTTKSITVTASTEDADATTTSGKSGIAGYRFKLDSGEWTGYQTSGTYTWDNLPQTTSHTITVEAKDNAGNTKQGTVTKGTGTIPDLAQGGITFSYSPAQGTWTKDSVTATASTTITGYTLQTSKDGQTWSNETSQTFTSNGTIYARLWDGTNYGGSASGTITNIDITQPTHTNWWWGEVTKDVARLYIQATDSESGINRVQCPTSTQSGGYSNWVWFNTVWDAGANAYRADITPATFGHYGETYTIHLYIWDNVENGGFYSATAVNIPALDVSTPSTSTTHTPSTITYSWDELSTIAKLISNNPSITNDTAEVNVTLNGVTQTLGVGDTATVDGLQVRILGFNHDTLTDVAAYGETTATGKAGISFEYVEILTKAQMNSSNTNSGGWGACALRKTLNETTYNSLNIKNNIKQVNKEYMESNENYDLKTTSSDYLWLLSCGEIWDNGFQGGITRGYAKGNEGNQYKYYKSNLGSTSYSEITDITKKGYYDRWWLRSICGASGLEFCSVYGDGSSYYEDAWDSWSVTPGFSI